MTRSNSARGIYDSLRQKDLGYYSVYSAAAGWMNSWRQINSRKQWLAGGFFWTGFDYLGEPRSPVSVSSSYGAIDLCGFEKDSFCASPSPPLCIRAYRRGCHPLHELYSCMYVLAHSRTLSA